MCLFNFLQDIFKSKDNKNNVVKILKYHKEAIIPNYQTPGSAGFDFHSCEETTIYPGEHKLISTGLKFELPSNSVLGVCSRSGLSLKNRVFVLNAPGIVDSDYRGEVKVILMNLGEEIFKIKVGDRIAQGVIFTGMKKLTFQTVDDLSETERGSGGFGSTGV